MEFLIGFIIFLFGLIIGSFLNVVIYRLETGETVVNGRSHCMRCGHVLEWYDLVPILSFLALGGKCRYCRKKISIQYPLVELFTGILFVAVINLQPIFTIYDLRFTIYEFFIISSLIVIFIYDLKHYIIPDKIIYLAIVVSLFYLISRQFLEAGLPGSVFGSPASGIYSLGNFLIAAILASAFFLSIVLITKGKGMGGGDVKLAFLMGLVLGWPKILPALFLAFATGAIYGIILIIMKEKTFKSEVPFGPFLALGTIAAMFWGEEIVKWYAGYLF